MNEIKAQCKFSTHSSCSDFNIAGMLVAVGGLGLTSGRAAQVKQNSTSLQFIQEN